MMEITAGIFMSAVGEFHVFNSLQLLHKCVLKCRVLDMLCEKLVSYNFAERNVGCEQNTHLNLVLGRIKNKKTEFRKRIIKSNFQCGE